MTAKEVTDFLLANAKLTKKSFDEKIFNTKEYVYGVPVPILRGFVKENCKKNFSDFIASEKRSVEEKIIFGLLIAQNKTDYDKFLREEKLFLPLIESWVVCDVVTTSLKIISKYKKQYFERVKSLLYSENPFERRYAIVVLLTYYLTDEYIDFILSHVERFTSNDYYVQMASAWLLSVAFIKQREKTLNYLKSSRLDGFTYSKTLSKITDSFRVSESDKQMIKNLKKSR